MLDTLTSYDSSLIGSAVVKESRAASKVSVNKVTGVAATTHAVFAKVHGGAMASLPILMCMELHQGTRDIITACRGCRYHFGETLDII